MIEREKLDLKLESLERTSFVPTISQWKSNREQQMCAKHQHSSRLPPKIHRRRHSYTSGKRKEIDQLF